ncbi:cytochrome P450 [Caballeronia sordidicola]|uniref:cytochrome P450 n=1 Tax=Caballeronia sordidicola TaxID=196367 RepID=UPI00068C48A6|nr:cytochrome P450 [Caballeronia sordidicola]
MSAVLAPTKGLPLGRPMVDAAFLQDPYPTYRVLREAGPIHWADEFFGGAWILTRHEDVAAVLRDPSYSARRTGGWVMRGREGEREELCPFQRLFSRALLFLDAPDHTRLRQVLNAGFRPQALSLYAVHIKKYVTDLIESLDNLSEFDFIEKVAKPLPARVIAKILGMDGDERSEFIEWSDDLAAFIGAPQPTHELTRRAQISLLKMSACFEQLLATRRRGEAGNDLIGQLLEAERAGKIGTGEELLAQCAMLLFAGQETTRNLLGNGLYALLSHPAQWRRLQEEPALLPNALRELLRYDSPVQYTGRRVATDRVLHGRKLERGQLVIALIGAANRDPTRYSDPDQLDVTRQQGSHLSFGHGPHVCIGAALTLMEAAITFRALLERSPRLTLAEAAPVWSGNPVYRGLRTLPVRNASKKPTGTVATPVHVEV